MRACAKRELQQDMTVIVNHVHDGLPVVYGESRGGTVTTQRRGLPTASPARLARLSSSAVSDPSHPGTSVQPSRAAYTEIPTVTASHVGPAPSAPPAEPQLKGRGF